MRARARGGQRVRLKWVWDDGGAPVRRRIDVDDLRFPPDFVWGTASAAHQVEGGCTNNNWARWEQQGRRPDGQLTVKRGQSAGAARLIALLRRAGDAGWPALCVVLGGPFGHAASVKERADDSVRLSKMVLNHQVAHVVLLEQLYRAWTILRGEPYHH